MSRLSRLMLPSCMALAMASAYVSAQTAPPPNFGEETKGEPAIAEIDSEQVQESVNVDSAAQAQSKQPQNAKKGEKSLADSVLGEATIKESRRENGQVYRIELEHSAGGKQYIEETGADGRLTTDDVNLEDTPNLPKWKLGSW